MLKNSELLISGLLLCCSGLLAQSQANSTTTEPTEQVRVIVASPDHTSDTIIAIPPDTSWTGSVAFRASSPTTNLNSDDMVKWLKTQSALNGLESTELHPWHIVIEYDQFDGDGDNVHSGTIEEVWAGPQKYKVTYKSDTLNQTDYATDRGLFRLGDQRWANRTEMQARTEIVNPFSYAATLQGFRTSAVERTFGAYNLHCVVLERTGGISIPTQYCFDHGGSVLRYVRGEGWFQTVYNDTVTIDGRNVGSVVEVTDGGHPFLTLRVKTLEMISRLDENDLTPPADAVSLSGKRVTGVPMKPLKTVFPEWPTLLQQQHFLVTVEIVIGKDGHVADAHAVSGPSEAYKAAENAVKKWTFPPYLVLGEPTEVESKVLLNNN